MSRLEFKAVGYMEIDHTHSLVTRVSQGKLHLFPMCCVTDYLKDGGAPAHPHGALVHGEVGPDAVPGAVVVVHPHAAKAALSF